jgi:hypothetical protein
MCVRLAYGAARSCIVMQLAAQAAKRDIEKLRGLCAIAAAASERFENMLALDFG